MNIYIVEETTNWDDSVLLAAFKSKDNAEKFILDLKQSGKYKDCNPYYEVCTIEEVPYYE